MALPNNVDANYQATFLASSFATSVNVSVANDIGEKIDIDSASKTNFSAVDIDTDYTTLEDRIDIPKFFEIKKGTLGWIDDLLEKDNLSLLATNIGAGKKFDFTVNTGKANGMDWGVVILDSCFLRYPNLVWDSANSEYVAIADFKEAFLYHWKNQSMLRFELNSDATLDTTMYEEKILNYIQEQYNDLGGIGIRTV